jgi:hypothetical protein
MVDIDKFRKRSIGGVGNSVIEGTNEQDEMKTDTILYDLIESVRTMPLDSDGESHLAIKLSGMLSI